MSGMTTETYGGVQWLPRALEAAHGFGIADELVKIALGFLLHGCKVGVEPEPGHEQERVRVRSSRRYVTISKDDGVILAFGKMYPHIRGARVHTIRKASRGKQSRGPRTWAELIEWLKIEGCELHRLGNDHYAVHRDSVMIGTLPDTPSDYRSLPNAVASLRRRGLTLRRSS